MTKVKTLDEVAKLIEQHKREGKTVGFVTGCFDVLHMGHLNTFRFAKKNTDIVVVGIDNDASIRMSKGKKRPINTQDRRADFLSDLSTVDWVFIFESVFASETAKEYENLKKVCEFIKPTHLITHKECDSYWKDKQKLCKEEGLALLLDESPKVTNTSTILEILESEW